jgi:hypothetical protein
VSFFPYSVSRRINDFQRTLVELQLIVECDVVFGLGEL